MRSCVFAVFVTLLSGTMLWFLPCTLIGAHIVENGRPLAEIVTPENPPRTVQLAAMELQEYVRRISGADLPITTEPSADWPVRIYVGRSAHTDRLGIDTAELAHGAFRMVSGETWLALVGADHDFVPTEPYGKNPYIEAELDQAAIDERRRLREEWDAITAPYGPYLSSVPHETVGRRYSGKLDLWLYDLNNSGTFNAVNRFLGDLGTRWYQPGEISEVVPAHDSIELPMVDETVRPDFAFRQFLIFYEEFFTNKVDEILWKLRLGQNQGELATPGRLSGHGILSVISRPETKERHPELYKMRHDGERATDHLGYGGACLSSEELLAANVQFARAMFDHYDVPLVAVGPEDGFVSLCACERCQGRDTPERGARGVFSDYVWDYVAQVADPLYESHPDRLIFGWAYSSYTLPPEQIEQLPPNVMVGFALPGVPDLSNEEDPFQQLVEQWRKKITADVPILQWDYFLANWPRGGDSVPPGVPDVMLRRIAEYLGWVQGKSAGLYAEVFPSVFSYLNVYVASAFLWDANQNVDELLEEYYTLYYGPAREEMKAFFEFCEAHWPAMRDISRGPELIDEAFELLRAGRTATEGGPGIYRQRIEVIETFMKPLSEQRDEFLALREKRRLQEGVTGMRATGIDIALDGRLEEAIWDAVPLQTLEGPEEVLWFRYHYPEHAASPSTTVRFLWVDDALYIGLHCEEPVMEKLESGTTRDGDMSIFEEGQSVELFFQTHEGFHYQIAVNPEGAVTTIEWTGDRMDSTWNSGVEAATAREDNFWSAEIRIPVTGGEGLAAGGVAGHAPSADAPWWINVGRVRRLEDQRRIVSMLGEGPFRRPHEYPRFTIVDEEEN